MKLLYVLESDRWGDGAGTTAKPTTTKPHYSMDDGDCDDDDNDDGDFLRWKPQTGIQLPILILAARMRYRGHHITLITRLSSFHKNILAGSFNVFRSESLNLCICARYSFQIYDLNYVLYHISNHIRNKMYILL